MKFWYLPPRRIAAAAAFMSVAVAFIVRCEQSS